MTELEDKSSQWETEGVINLKHYYIQSKHQEEQQLQFIYITRSRYRVASHLCYKKV